MYSDLFVRKLHFQKNRRNIQTWLLAGKLAKVTDNDSDDDSIDSESRSENLRNQHLGEQFPILSITQSATGTADSNR